MRSVCSGKMSLAYTPVVLNVLDGLVGVNLVFLHHLDWVPHDAQESCSLVR